MPRYGSHGEVDGKNRGNKTNQELVTIANGRRLHGNGNYFTNLFSSAYTSSSP
jgi:hypothetical protein